MSSDNRETHAFSISSFCKSHEIGRSTFYLLLKQGKGPRLMRVGAKTLISAEAAAAWRRRMEEAEVERVERVERTAEA